MGVDLKAVNAISSKRLLSTYILKAKNLQIVLFNFFDKIAEIQNLKNFVLKGIFVENIVHSSVFFILRLKQ